MSQMRTPFERLLFVKDLADARILVDAAVSGDFPLSKSLCPTTIRSGAAFVFKEELTTAKKKKGIVDGLDWTHSRSCGPFLLYRQVAHIGLDPYRAYRQSPVQEESALFRSTRSRLNSTLIPNGLAKRTITITAKNQCRYRVINYFLPRHVEQFYNRSARYKVGEGVLLRPSQAHDCFCESTQAKVPSTSKPTIIQCQPSSSEDYVATPRLHFKMHSKGGEQHPSNRLTLIPTHPSYFDSPIVLPPIQI